MNEPYKTLPFPAGTGGAQIAARDWQHWGGTAAGTRYVPFDQINASNVGKLQVAWTYRTGVGGAFKATPLQIGDTLYVCLARNIISALDADTGAERWRFDPRAEGLEGRVHHDVSRRHVFQGARAAGRLSGKNPDRDDGRATDCRSMRGPASAAPTSAPMAK